MHVQLNKCTFRYLQNPTRIQPYYLYNSKRVQQFNGYNSKCVQLTLSLPLLGQCGQGRHTAEDMETRPFDSVVRGVGRSELRATGHWTALSSRPLETFARFYEGNFPQTSCPRESPARGGGHGWGGVSRGEGAVVAPPFRKWRKWWRVRLRSCQLKLAHVTQKRYVVTIVALSPEYWTKSRWKNHSQLYQVKFRWQRQ